jgi:hypothetical protein
MDVESNAELHRFVAAQLKGDDDVTRRALLWPSSSIPDGLAPIDEILSQLPPDLQTFYAAVDPERRLIELSALRELADLVARMQVDDKYGGTASQVLRLLAYRYKAQPGYKTDWEPDGFVSQD